LSTTLAYRKLQRLDDLHQAPSTPLYILPHSKQLLGASDKFFGEL
jgi:hypothetical protein